MGQLFSEDVSPSGRRIPFHAIDLARLPHVASVANAAVPLVHPALIVGGAPEQAPRLGRGGTRFEARRGGGGAAELGTRQRAVVGRRARGGAVATRSRQIAEVVGLVLLTLAVRCAGGAVEDATGRASERSVAVRVAAQLHGCADAARLGGEVRADRRGLSALAVTEYRGTSKAWSTSFAAPPAVQYPCFAIASIDGGVPAPDGGTTSDAGTTGDAGTNMCLP